MALTIKRNCKEKIIVLHSVVKGEVNRCNLSENNKFNLGIKKEKPGKPNETKPLVKISRDKGKLEVIKSLKSELTKLTGSWGSFF